ncbi:hypothetical protein GH714_022929 [Hevea brasiliensis]|uniref:Uncharacterized protein n=1 Tax=Hevea brasiliensis TaxID=3981 RepID=A0A6A6LZX5_HEVBR|nr:hypothetical protein GH714_022929 [Hevea brasiliensis]
MRSKDVLAAYAMRSKDLLAAYDCFDLPSEYFEQLPRDLRLDLNDVAFDLSNGPVIDECGQELGELLLNLSRAWELADISTSRALASKLPMLEAFGKRLVSAGRRFQSMGQYGQGEMQREEDKPKMARAFPSDFDDDGYFDRMVEKAKVEHVAIKLLAEDIMFAFMQCIREETMRSKDLLAAYAMRSKDLLAAYAMRSKDLLAAYIPKGRRGPWRLLDLPSEYFEQLPRDLRLDLNDAAFDLSNGPVIDSIWQAFGTAGRRFQLMGQYGQGEMQRYASISLCCVLDCASNDNNWKTLSASPIPTTPRRAKERNQVFKFGELQVEVTPVKANIGAVIGVAFGPGYSKHTRELLAVSNDNAILLAKSLRGALLVLFYSSTFLSAFTSVDFSCLEDNSSQRKGASVVQTFSSSDPY